MATETRTNVRTKKRTTVRSAMFKRSARWLGEHFPEATASLALAAWFRPRRFDPPRREHYWKMGALEFHIGRGTHGVRAWSWGQGPTVLLVHGWEGRGMQLGGFVQPLVDAGFRVVTWDAPAHGNSPGSRASLFSFADTVLAAARQLGPIHGIVGHSMGGAASILALQAGVPVSRVALIAPGDPARAGERVASAFGLTDEVTEAMARSLRERFGQSLAEVSTARLIGRIDAPVLIVHDRGDRYADFSDAEAMAEAAPNAQLVEVASLGHHRILRDADVIEAVATHIAGKPVDVLPRGVCMTQDDLLRDLHHGRD